MHEISDVYTNDAYHPCDQQDKAIFSSISRLRTAACPRDHCSAAEKVACEIRDVKEENSGGCPRGDKVVATSLARLNVLVKSASGAAPRDAREEALAVAPVQLVTAGDRTVTASRRSANVESRFIAHRGLSVI